MGWKLPQVLGPSCVRGLSPSCPYTLLGRPTSLTVQTGILWQDLFILRLQATLKHHLKSEPLLLGVAESRISGSQKPSSEPNPKGLHEACVRHRLQEASQIAPRLGQGCHSPCHGLLCGHPARVCVSVSVGHENLRVWFSLQPWPLEQHLSCGGAPGKYLLKACMTC